MKTILRILKVLVGLPILYLVLVILAATLFDYKPELEEKLWQGEGDVVEARDTFRVFNWNIGYAGLGDDMSFFYDGGDKTRTSKERTLENLQAIEEELLKQKEQTDFFLLQEVDMSSTRSYRVNEQEAIRAQLAPYHSFFALNYKVGYIPMPFFKPMGKVKAGLGSYTRFAPSEVERYSFTGNYGWPKGTMMLDRCFMLKRFALSNGKELVLINTHNSAYDDGSLRTQQMEYLRGIVEAEYEAGNYVVVGGDWNQNPPHKGDANELGGRGHLANIRISANFMPKGWRWVYQEKPHTNRLIDEVYRPGKTITSVIDFFLVSPNVKVLKSANHDLQFKHSDHNPVSMTFCLK